MSDDLSSQAGIDQMVAMALETFAVNPVVMSITLQIPVADRVGAITIEKSHWGDEAGSRFYVFGSEGVCLVEEDGQFVADADSDVMVHESFAGRTPEEWVTAASKAYEAARDALHERITRSHTAP